MAAPQVALVVGASRGIGRQVAVDLAKEGYSGQSIHEKTLIVYRTNKIPQSLLPQRLLPMPTLPHPFRQIRTHNSPP